MNVTTEEIHLKGVPICPGIAIGKLFVLTVEETSPVKLAISTPNVEAEVDRYRVALARSKEDIQHLRHKLEGEHAYEGSAILEAHLQIMQDPLMTSEIEVAIRNSRRNAEFTFQKVISQYQKKFNSLAEPFFRERFKDLQEISKRVLDYLLESVRFSMADIPSNSIVFAKELSASESAEADCGSVKAFITEVGGTTSHAAILAKARGIPYVASVPLLKLRSQIEGPIIVDGRTGDVILNPNDETLAYYEKIHKALNYHYEKMQESALLIAETYDGYDVKVSANVEMIDDVKKLHEFGGSGVGLFRSENILLTHKCFPPEDHQFSIYRDLVQATRGLPVVIRTFDIGGDKCLVKNLNYQEGNPFLGCRAIRFLLRERAIFKTQLRAILRASAYGNVSILLPMISSLTELQESKSIIAELQEELRDQHTPHDPNIHIGCMVEVPSAAIISDLLARESNFLSIGTNDLVQYSLAVDRGNPALSPMYTPTHPSVIRLIKMVVTEAKNFNTPVSICGEIAADPRFTPLLIGLGIKELSVATRYIPLIKNAIRNTSIVSARKLAEKALTLPNAHDILELLTLEYKVTVPEDCFFNC